MFTFTENWRRFVAAAAAGGSYQMAALRDLPVPAANHSSVVATLETAYARAVVRAEAEGVADVYPSAATVCAQPGLGAFQVRWESALRTRVTLYCEGDGERHGVSVAVWDDAEGRTVPAPPDYYRVVAMAEVTP